MKHRIPITAPEDITVGQFVDFHNAKSKAQKAAVATGKTLEEVNGLGYQIVKEIVRQFETFIEECPVMGFAPIVELDGQEYGFEPDLEKLETGAYADLEHIETQGISTRLHKYLAILYRPVIQRWGNTKPRYRIEKYSASGGDAILNADLFRDFPLSKALGVRAFFLTLLSELQNASQKQLLKELKTATKEMCQEVMR